jgi:phosphate transport system substrate-binding protein
MLGRDEISFTKKYKTQKRKEKERMNQSTSRIKIIAVLIAAMTFVAISSVALVSPAKALLNGSYLQLDGSSTVYPITADAIPGFAAFYHAETGGTTGTPTVPFPAPGSGTGWTEIGGAGGPQTIDVCESSKFPSLTNIQYLPNCRIYPIGIDSISIIVNNAGGNTPGNYVTKLTQTQVMQIFTGQITDWHAINSSIPSGTTIHVAVRVSTSGTADCFKNFFLTPFKLSTSNITSSATVCQENQDIINLMTQSSSAWYIAYVGLGFTDVTPAPQVQPVSISFDKSLGSGSPYVYPSKANVLNGSYLPYRYLWYATPNLSTDPVINCWISYVRHNVTMITGPTTNNWVTENGYIQLWWGDFTNSTSVPVVLLGGAGGATPTDGCPPQQHNYPDQKVNYNDVVFFVDAYIAANTPGGYVNPLCDYYGNGKINYYDIIAFCDCYIAANS